MLTKRKKDAAGPAPAAAKDNTVDSGIINQYETAMQMLNAEL